MIPISKEEFTNGSVSYHMEYNLLFSVNKNMSKLSERGTSGKIASRIAAPFVYTGTLLISLALRVAWIVEPIIIGIGADIVIAVKDREPKSLSNICWRPVQVGRNFLAAIILSLSDSVVLGSGAITGIASPKVANGFLTYYCKKWLKPA